MSSNNKVIGVSLNLGAERIMVKLHKSSDRLWSAIFSVIVYGKFSNFNHIPSKITERSKIGSKTQKMFLGKFKNIICFQDTDFVSSTCVAWSHKRGSTWETLKSADFECFTIVSRFVPKQHKICVLEEKMLLKFSENIFCVLDAFLLRSATMFPCLLRRAWKKRKR